MKNFKIGKSTAGFPFFVLLLFFIALSNMAVAQYNEFGAGLGGLNYSGDLAKTPKLGNFKPGFTAFYRRNLNHYSSFRASITGGKIAASDDKPFDSFDAMRDESFNISLFELSGIFEYYFLDFRTDKALVNWSPYIFGGLAMFTFNNSDPKRGQYSNVQPSIPLGIGFRYNLSPQLSLSLEIGARKTFFDYLDNISEGNPYVKDYKYGNYYNNDWYYFAGLSMSYTIYNVPCPFKVK
jgi:hypothetical protein